MHRYQNCGSYVAVCGSWKLLETLRFSRLIERNVSSFNHAQAQQRRDNFSRHDDAPGPPEGGYVVVFFSM